MTTLNIGVFRAAENTDAFRKGAGQRGESRPNHRLGKWPDSQFETSGHATPQSGSCTSTARNKGSGV